ncbi:Pro-Pol polyprotein, partial [Dictyocoela muelleri]
ELKFKLIISDNGKEFRNKNIAEWCNKRGIEQKFSIPYFHEENGRIERANRTLRNALNKEKGKIKEKLNKVLNTYNGIKHRGIGMSPNEALKSENFEKVLEIQNKYSKEFGKKNLEQKFKKGDKVLIRKEIKVSKADKEFEPGGLVYKIISPEKYVVINEEGIHVKKHESQLKLEGGM